MLASSRAHHQFDAQQFPFSLWRLSDEEFRQLRSRSFPIQIDDLFWLLLELRQSDRSNLLNLPKALLVLESEFGFSSTYIDSWKQTFSFPFLLAISKPTDIFYYLLIVEDYRGGLEFRLYRIVDDLKYANENLEVFHEPIADEFSEDDIKYSICYLWGFLEGYANSLDFSNSQIQPFFRHIDSSHVIYGYWDGKFVEEIIEDLDEYESTVRTLEAKYGEPPISDTVQMARTQRMIQEIVS
jgi:hypothetical protein